MPRKVDKRATVTRKRTGVTLRRTTVYLPPDLFKRLQHRCVDEDRDLSDVIAEAVAALLDRK